MWPVMELKVGSSTPQFGAKTSVKSSSDGLQFKVLFLVQLLLHNSMYCKAMQPSPGLSFSSGSLWAVRFWLIMLTRSFAGFPVGQTTRNNLISEDIYILRMLTYMLLPQQSLSMTTTSDVMKVMLIL